MCNLHDTVIADDADISEKTYFEIKLTALSARCVTKHVESSTTALRTQL